MTRPALRLGALALWLGGAAIVALPPGCALRDGLQGEDKRDSPSIGGGKRFTEDELKAKDDVVGYAEYCKQELGLPPKVLDPWNCVDGTEIPVTVDGKVPDAATYQQLRDGKVGCDLPSWLSEQPCANYGFVQQRQLSPDVVALLLCRMRTFSTPDNVAARRTKLIAEPTVDNYKSFYRFESIGLIWSNTKTGKTCFFDVVGDTYGARVASPDDTRVPKIADHPPPKPPKGTETLWRRDSRGTWRSPAEVVVKDNCVRCHDAGPFKTSPWITQAFAVPPNPQDVPYEVVGSVFDDWRKRFPARSISTTPIKNASGVTEPQVCTTCHRIGAHATCDRYLEHATGKTAPDTLSARGQSFFYRTWMPPPPGAWHGKTEAELTTLWADSYERHVTRLKCCCQNPKARGCLVQDFGTAPFKAPVAGTGPATCE